MVTAWSKPKPFFALSYVSRNPGEHLDQLARVIAQEEVPPEFAGQTPVLTAWRILFNYLQAQPVADIRAGQWNRFLDVLERGADYSAAEPRDIYAFYLQRGLKARSAKYRELATDGIGYDLDSIFKEVEKNPAKFQGS